MRIYYTTYFFQGSIQPDERYPTPFVVDGIVRFYYSILEKMLTMYPVLDADETERGMIDRIEFLRFAKNNSWGAAMVQEVELLLFPSVIINIAPQLHKSSCQYWNC